MSSFSNKKYQSIQGFSLIEILITLAIIGIVTGLVMVRYGSFNSIVLLKNQTYKVALDIREAQVLATSVRGAGSSFREEYGVYFSTQTAPERQSYKLFQDNGATQPAQYDAGEEIGSPRYLDNRFEITEICINSSTIPCPPANVRDRISISFARPDFDAEMRVGAETPSTARIKISSTVDAASYRTVFISPTGQISIE